MTGFSSPNYTQAPNDLFDTLMKDMSEAELKVVMVAIRKTFGYHKNQDAISFTQFQDMTGLSRQSVADGVDAAIKRGVLKIAGHGKRGVNIYELVVILDQSENQTSTSQENGLDADLTSQKSRHTKETDSKENKRNSPKPPKGDKKSKQYPSGYAVAKWTDELIAQFSDEYTDGLTALLCATGLVEMYPTIKNMPRRDAVKYVEALRELTRLGCPTTQFESLWVYTRTMLNWRRNTPTPLDMVDQYTAWRQSRNPQLASTERAERDKRLLAANGLKEIVNG